MRAEYEMLMQRHAALGAACHAMVMRHGRQVFDRAQLDELCSMSALRFGLEGDSRVVVDLAAQAVPDEGKVT
jgi:hypothetical protein